MPSAAMCGFQTKACVYLKAGVRKVLSLILRMEKNDYLIIRKSLKQVSLQFGIFRLAKKAWLANREIMISTHSKT